MAPVFGGFGQMGAFLATAIAVVVAKHPRVQVVEYPSHETSADAGAQQPQVIRKIIKRIEHTKSFSLVDRTHADTNATEGRNGLASDINEPELGEGEVIVEELPNHADSLKLSWTWLEYVTLGAVVKGACIIGNVMNQLSPYPSVRKIRAKGDTGDFNALPFVAIGFNGVQWCFYGVFAWSITNNRAFLVLVYANVCGALAGSFYTLTFHRLCHSPDELKKLLRYYRCCVVIAFAQLLALFVLPMSQAMFFEGFMASACSVLVNVSSIVCTPTILRTRCTEAMPVELALVSFVSSVLWLTCGIMLDDWWIIFPNIIGILAGFMAIGLLLRFPRSSSTDLSSRKAVTEATPLFHKLSSAKAGLVFFDGSSTGGTPDAFTQVKLPSPFTAPALSTGNESPADVC